MSKINHFLYFPFIGDKDRYSFPADMPILHAEFTYFYYPGDFIFPRKFFFAIVNILIVNASLFFPSFI